MGGACCGCDPHIVLGGQDVDKKEAKYKALSQKDAANGRDSNAGGGPAPPTPPQSIEHTEEWREYKKMMQEVFYAFAGYQPWAKLSIPPSNQN